MALTAGTIWEIRGSSTTLNVNGSGFNPANANALTDLTTDANTANTNSPVVSSASYNFAAGDVNAWLYIVSGTNWTPGWYQIASVASNKATLSASVGQAIQRDTTLLPHKYYTNTVAGCATVGTPTGGTFLIDYSQQDTAQATNTNLTCTAGSTTVTSASAPFTRMMVGNIIHLTALTGTGAITGWYEVVNYTDTSNIVLDRTPTNGVNNITAGTFYVGGAGRLNSLEDAYFEMTPASSYIWIKNSSYTISGNINIASTLSSTTTHSQIIGYNTTRGDNPTSTTRPTIVAGANTCTFGQYQNLRNVIFTVTSPTGIVLGNGASFTYCKGVNTSTGTGRPALTSGNTAGSIFFCEGVSYNGTALVLGGSSSKIEGCWGHDSDTALNSTVATNSIENCIVSRCSTAGGSFNSSSGGLIFTNNTIYGRQAKQGTGLNCSSGSTAWNRMTNNIFYGLATAISMGVSTPQNSGDYNVFYNNTANTNNYNISQTDSTTLNPTFTSATEITGTTATTSGSVLTQSGGNFSSVVDGESYLFITSGTGIASNRRYGIVSHTSTTITTDNSIGTSSAGDVVYWIGVGNNFAVGTNMKAIAYPGVFPGGLTTGYLDAGAAQRQETGGSSAGGYTFGG